MLARIVVLLAVFAASDVACAFGPLGHETVAEIASRQLNPRARAEVERLLGDRASNAMREVSGWADDVVHAQGHKELGPLHYVNFPRDTCRYDAARDCRDGRCAEAALVRYANVLATSRDDAERAEALKWVIHLVADVHQPLHAGYADDRGAVNRQVQDGRKNTNLHSLWDSGLINKRGMRAVPYADFLLQKPGPKVDATWSPRAPARWLEESCELIGGARIYDVGKRLDGGYVHRAQPVIERRLREAGFRLAALLNATLRVGTAPN